MPWGTQDRQYLFVNYVDNIKILRGNVISLSIVDMFGENELFGGYYIEFDRNLVQTNSYLDDRAIVLRNKLLAEGIAEEELEFGPVLYWTGDEWSAEPSINRHWVDARKK